VPSVPIGEPFANPVHHSHRIGVTLIDDELIPSFFHLPILPRFRW